MPRLRSMSGQQARAILERHGFTLARQRGSHMMMRKTTPEGNILVPIPNHRELDIGTLASIIRLSGLDRALFEV